jgi:hypothetical protein
MFPSGKRKKKYYFYTHKVKTFKFKNQLDDLIDINIKK